ncbi:hypothetical protein AVEN_124551-1 [Araneus ventricosus]|uniref:Uncharacterized protein n=1 Tax=Araneus ventricosus TaxID=182803 RepID=A0A4Y2JVH0_ARAVE|nr:hypothetical protein AVEN_124551-1 [Araneus ventricosus]
MRSRGGLGVEKFQVRNPIPPKIRHVLGLLHVKPYVGVKRPPAGVVEKVGEGMPAEVSSSSSDRGSNLRGPYKIALVLLLNGTFT